jgi:hypothetical protein
MATPSRKHYAAVASIIAGDLAITYHAPLAHRAVADLARSLADVYAQENPRFDRDRFYVACTLGKCPDCSPDHVPVPGLADELAAGHVRQHGHT